jgi:hypothetical protein
MHRAGIAMRFGKTWTMVGFELLLSAVILYRRELRIIPFVGKG